MSSLVNRYDEKVLKPINGWLALGIWLVALGVFVAIGIVSTMEGWNMAISIVAFVLAGISAFVPIGLKIVGPNEALVLLLFGKYYGTVKKEGFFWVNPFTVPFNPAVAAMGNKKLSLKSMTLDNKKQKVNDMDGNPIEIGVIVIWQICDTAKAVFNVENYYNYISIQSDAAIRNIARQFPYDVASEGDEKSLRGSSQEIANTLCCDLQERVSIAGIQVVEARIAHLAYAQEIAAAMLQRQQAKAIVDARIKIVEGAVGMVELALEKLSADNIVALDEDKKAQLVSNLMVVLCSSKDTQPIVNSGSLSS